MLVKLLVLLGFLLLVNSGTCVATDPSTGNISNNSDLNITQQQGLAAAGEVKTTPASSTTTLKEQYNTTHGIWIQSDDIGKINVTALQEAGITDVFIKVSRVGNYNDTLTLVQQKLSGSSIRVQAWITSFLDANGNWVDPEGHYSYTVQVPYQKTVQVAYQQWYKGWYKQWYQSKYKKWYKSGKKWRYSWVSRSKYRWKYGWTTRTAYRYEIQTAYNTATRYGTDTSLNDKLVQFSSDLASSNLVNGVHLDYVRYPGTAYKHEDGTGAITNFVQRVNTAVKSVNPQIALSAALMPEGSVNAYFYGQSYSQLSTYLDFLVPMIYKGNFQQDTNWIGQTTAYIVSQANGTPVIVGLQSYISDKNLKPLSAVEITQDIDKAMENGASGYVLFRYGLIDPAFLIGANFDAPAAQSETKPTTTYPAELQPYLQPTANCQSNDARIVTLAQSITAGASSNYDIGQRIFNWVRDNLDYSWYYNSAKGAVNAMLSRTANCCDMSHLIVALSRAAGLPARYRHGTCTFSSGTFGHVWADIYVDGNWIPADATSNANSFGIIRNWNTNSWSLKGVYAQLPF
ncbi:MAG: transglutaminase domain-containing protein [Methanobacteriaceae archaeon]|nr:transglutaminase domain-containing protein [Methanobacteriaceae archaeon]